MNTSVSNPDSSAPSAPGALSASGGLSSASLSWGAATDNVGVVRYNVHRGDELPGSRRRWRTGSRSRRGRATPTPGGGGDVLLPGRRRGRGRQCRAGLERGVGDGRGHAGAVGAGDAVGGRGGREGDAVLGGGDRQRRCGALQRPSRHQRRLHAARGQPDRAADHARLRRHDRARQLLLQGHRRGRGRQHRRRLERGRARR